MNNPYRVQNPATNEIVEEFDFITDTALEDALATAHETFGTWRELSYAERGERLAEAAKLFDARRETLAKLIAEEMGKSIEEGDGEVDDCVEILNYYAENGAEFGADQQLPHDGDGSVVIRKVPLGVIVGVMPWNYPYYQAIRFAAPALMAGNVVMVKHAEICPRSSEAIEEIFTDAGLPAGAVTNIYATHDQIETLIADPRVQGVSLTGSERAGRAIGKLAGENLKKCVLELGGTDAYVVLDADDVPEAAKTAWKKRSGNTGQSCTSNKRMIVMEDIFDDFVAELVKLAEATVAGDPMNPGAAGEREFFPLSSRDAAEKLVGQIEDAVEAGAKLHTGGELTGEGAYFTPAVITDIAVEAGAKLHTGGELTGEGAYFTPAVITDIPVGSDIYYEEFFGPVAAVYRVSTEEEAIELANNSRYGLGGAVMSTDTQRAKRVADKIETGMIHVNIPQARGAELPFGGIKNSGLGRELGPLGMDEFVNMQRFYVAD
ncbi:NAD-dependent succinate-semialdehyde dehydrogenase [Corynebacterium sp. CNCTC7651]|uniref:NAD-dependent succinate-semialdehyde dehydrogenase n=1 Tax=Corynebacterium sp. CNCTC7651 TaxID=2815361 RepID=UPI001F3A9D59|nr:NAD-dependent succinate-semialdehyde dehydrogenase [Corynebacterium sp. CNCTC7651]UIZ91650.1 NAD-dependent succinate-semialdehyde dehydrogenase [Corynebacterium sp. CNCTC7651]